MYIGGQYDPMCAKISLRQAYLEGLDFSWSLTCDYWEDGRTLRQYVTGSNPSKFDPLQNEECVLIFAVLGPPTVGDLEAHRQCLFPIDHYWAARMFHLDLEFLFP